MSKQSSPPSSDVVEAIFAHNAGRDPERLTLKYAKMAQSPFIFLRGACHLFYDEAALAPVNWDVIRLLTSIQCGADALNASRAESLAVSQSCLEAHRSTLIDGKPLWVERDTCSGLINELLTTLQDRKRATFLDKRTIRKGHSRSLKLDDVKALPASDRQKEAVTKFIDRFGST